METVVNSIVVGVPFHDIFEFYLNHRLMWRLVFFYGGSTTLSLSAPESPPCISIQAFLYNIMASPLAFLKPALLHGGLVSESRRDRDHVSLEWQHFSDCYLYR
eukprot:scaffold143848_cov27-Prasinocladus_malaysianus.AAC.1